MDRRKIRSGFGGLWVAGPMLVSFPIVLFCVKTHEPFDCLQFGHPGAVP